MRMASLFCVAVLWFPSQGRAQGHCSLTVRVLTPDGIRLEAPVSVKEHDGRVQELE